MATPESAASFKQQLLHWAASFPYSMFLDTCGTTMDRYGEFECLVGVASAPASIRDLAALEASTASGKWLYGALGYGLKGTLEPRLQDGLAAAIDVGDVQFFEAEVVVALRRGRQEWEFLQGNEGECRLAIARQSAEPHQIVGFSGFQSNFSQAEYCAAVEALREHIRAGDSYEINLSQNFTADGRLSSPAALWERLVANSPVPFAAFGRWEERYLLCASPERFLQLKDGRLLTQPIKGTAPRSADAETDAALAATLAASEKERAENVMIVDLSRNDLHRSCEVGSVTVPYLWEVQHFRQVHHLVSTIAGRLRSDITPTEALRNTFPPGSMTGAPKVRTCELIAAYERRGRGFYAGSVGYFAPNGDFDLNVVIRSLVYDAQAHRLSYHVGGAITWDSDPEAEYAETILKAQAISRLFPEVGGPGDSRQ